jgi:hypothetical protein
MTGREENKQLQPFQFAASMTFFDSRFMSGVACVEQSVIQQQQQGSFGLVFYCASRDLKKKSPFN